VLTRIDACSQFMLAITLDRAVFYDLRYRDEGGSAMLRVGVYFRLASFDVDLSGPAVREGSQ
jgi:hypothetical protein